MLIAITGANGQVGQALQKTLSKHDVIPLTRPKFDLTKPAVVEKIRNLNADLVIHCAAMTHVDGCAKDPNLAYLVNGFWYPKCGFGLPAKWGRHAPYFYQ